MPKREPIVIQEPPIQEIGKRRSCLKRTCLTGLGCIGVFLLASLLLLKLISGPKSLERKALPPELISAVPIYDQENISSISYRNGLNQHPVLETMAYVPKIALAPIVLSQQTPSTTRTQQLRDYLRTPLIDQFDTYTIVWDELTATPSFLTSYYKTELEKAGFAITSAESASVIYFQKEDINGSATVVRIDETHTQLTLDIHVAAAF